MGLSSVPFVVPELPSRSEAAGGCSQCRNWRTWRRRRKPWPRTSAALPTGPASTAEPAAGPGHPCLSPPTSEQETLPGTEGGDAAVVRERPTHTHPFTYIYLITHSPPHHTLPIPLSHPFTFSLTLSYTHYPSHTHPPSHSPIYTDSTYLENPLHFNSTQLPCTGESDATHLELT